MKKTVLTFGLISGAVMNGNDVPRPLPFHGLALAAIA